jgi:hypothetical protein
MNILGFWKPDPLTQQLDDGTTTTAQEDVIVLGSEGAEDPKPRHDRELMARERRLNERERKLQGRERDVSFRESRMTEDKQSWKLQKQSLEKNLERYRAEKYAAIKEAREAGDMFRRSESDVIKLKQELEHSQQHRRALEGELHRRQQDIQIIQDTTKRMEAQHGLTRELLEARTLELKAAQSFLTTADKLSGADVSAMVGGLNGEIHQTAAFMAESFEFQELKAYARDDGTIGRTWTEEILGPTMLKLLSSVRHCEDPQVVQIALQACMTNLAARVITTWHLDSSKDQSLLVNIYSQMQETAGGRQVS